MASSSASIDFKYRGIGEQLQAHFFRVPPHQREYSWDRDHVQDLLEDLSDAFGANYPDYFLGMIVLTKREDDSLWIADGQQRLATTSILLAAIRDYLKEMDEPTFAQQIDSMFLRASALGSHETTPKIRLNTQDDEYYRKHILLGEAVPNRSVDGKPSAHNRDGKPSSHKRMEVAASMAAEFVRRLYATNSRAAQVEKLMQFAMFIRDRATIALVTAPDDLGAYRMFETLNDRGLEAAQSDLIKSYLLQRAEKDKRGPEVLDRWTSMVSDLGAKRTKAVVKFLRHYYYSEYGHVREHNLFAKLREKVPTGIDALELAGQMESAANDYMALSRPDDEKWLNYGATTRQHLEILRLLRVDQMRPLHLAVARRFSQAEAKKAFRLFVACSVRLAVGGGNKIGRIDRECAERAVKVGRDITTAKELAKAMAEIIPTDAQFEPNFAVAIVNRPDVARYILRSLESHLQGDSAPELIPNSNQDVIDLEHILPKHPGAKWGIDPNEADALVNRLGNMALLKKSVNKTIGNGSFDEKKKAFKGSTFALTSAVAKRKVWDADSILDRQKEMAKLATAIWPITAP